jgi:hypothetical protein
MTQIVTEGIPPFLDRRPKTEKPTVYSFTMLNTYAEICPHQMAHRYVWKTLPFVETDAMRWGTKVHEAMELRIGGRKPLPPEMNKWEKFAAPFDGYKIETEMKLGMTHDGKACDFFAPEVWFRGKIDVPVVNGTSAAIFDHKTGSSKYERAFELETNALLLKARFPALQTVKGYYIWLAEDRLGPPHNLSDFTGTWKRVNEIVANIEHDCRANEFVKRKSGLCGHCDVRSCEHNRKPP